MQTFLPYPDFEQSARCLDRARLGKQRVEAWQLLEANRGISSLRWSNHPAAKMWKGYEFGLCWYGQEICREWIRRGYKDTMLQRFNQALIELPQREVRTGENFIWWKYTHLPKWLGSKEFHLSHMSNLLRKNSEHYIVFFGGGISTDLPYVWPV